MRYVERHSSQPLLREMNVVFGFPSIYKCIINKKEYKPEEYDEKSSKKF